MGAEIDTYFSRYSVRARRRKMQIALFLCFIWIGLAHSIKYMSFEWLIYMADKLEPARHLFVSKIVEIRVRQGDDPLTYAIYCYCVIPVYLICFYLVLRSFHRPPLDKIPEGENSAKAFYKKRFIVFAVAFYTMIMVSLYLPKYFFTQRQTHDLTMLAVFDIIEMWCQALFLGMCISSIRDYKKEAAVLR